jgi:hypothetical protein
MFLSAKIQRRFSIVSITVFQPSAVFQHMYQHCVSAVTALCFSISSSYVSALCFCICDSASVFHHLCSNTCVPAFVFQHLCSSICVSASVFHHLCFSICVSAFVFQHLCFSFCVSASVFQLLCSIISCACSITNRLPSMKTVIVCDISAISIFPTINTYLPTLVFLVKLLQTKAFNSIPR